TQFIALLHSLHHPHAPPSFPTRRSSDLHDCGVGARSRAIDRGQGEREQQHEQGRLLRTSAKDCQKPSHLGTAARQRSASSSPPRSEEHTSELRSPYDIVCRLLLEKKKHT